MDFYLISPRVDGQTIEGFVKTMFEQSIIMMGWGTDNKIGLAFSQIKKGDFVIVAQRVNWKFNYYFAGIVSSDSCYTENGYQCREIEHLIDLRKSKDDYLGDASFAEMQVIKALMQINSYNNEHIINRLEKILNNYIIMEEYIKLLINNKNLILTGAPGTGKTYLAKQIAEALGAKDERYGFVQFHPSYDYSDFIEGLRPVKNDDQKEIGFERKDGIFMNFCRKALKAYQSAENEEEAPKYVFVIDEINRGEMSKIFGELFFSIDPGYRGVDGRITTQYANLWTDNDMYDMTLNDAADRLKFYIPKNVYIIGTMNDIDRSVESMDFAMRRRFAFKEVKAATRVEMINESKKLNPFFDKIKERMNNLNLCILTIQGLNSAYQIGASYYLKLENYLINEELTDESWTNLWDNHLSGLLFEYLRGMPEADKILNEQLYYAYTLKDKYKEENGKAVKIEKVNDNE